MSVTERVRVFVYCAGVSGESRRDRATEKAERAEREGEEEACMPDANQESVRAQHIKREIHIQTNREIERQTDR